MQSVSLDVADRSDYWPAMLPDTRPARALLLGAGGGTLAALLQRRFGGVRVLAVDDDPRVVALGRRSFYLNDGGVDAVIADAFAFAAVCPAEFDYIAVDLFRGAERPRGLFARPFLRDLQRLATPRGQIVFNLFRDRRAAGDVLRIARVLSVIRTVEAGRNVVVHCRAR